jgi:hypothetical protein
VIRARDALVRATLYPHLEVRADPARVLHAGRDRVSASAPESVPFVVSAPARPEAKYWLFACLAGRRLGGYVPGGTPFFPGPPGVLDALGRSEPIYTAPAGVLVPLIGLRFEWSAWIFGGGPLLESNVVGFDVVP